MPGKSIGGMRATLFTSAAAMGSLMVGILILAGGPIRFSSPVFATARDLAPWWVWGSVMTASGLMALAAAARHIMWAARVGHMAACMVYIFLVIALIGAAWQTKTAPLTGIGIYTAFAFIHALAAASADEGRGIRQVRRAAE